MTVLSVQEKLQKLTDLQHAKLTQLAEQVIQRSSKAQRQDSYKNALVELNKSFEQYFAEAATIAFGLHPAQAKKIRYKKDRIKTFKQHGLDYQNIDGAETAQILSLIAQAIVYEDATVTADLDNTFPFWKEGYPMVQFDNTYSILAEDISLHFQQVLQELSNYLQ
ncbi:MAG: hypothetical protein E6Q26_02150 [Acinetobacter sp.]|nr:MAG: hypothetical protein E6Q26_02150 [Acinetobacter sp.]